MDNLQEQLTAEFSRATRRWRALLDEKLKRTGLTTARWLVLRTLSRDGDGLFQKDLADLLSLEGPTLVRILDALEKQGLVERREDARDRRAKRIHLTPRAHPVIQDIERIVATVRQQNFAAIRRDDLETCLAVFRQINEQLDKGQLGGGE